MTGAVKFWAYRLLTGRRFGKAQKRDFFMKKKNNTPELDMVNDCFEYLKDLAMYKYIVLEIPFLSRCIDMVLITPNEKLITIEFKISDINHAIEQARDHRLGADYSFICIPKRKNIENQLFKKEKIGLLYYNKDQKVKIETIIIAPYNKPVELFRKQLINNTIKVNS
jgi:hypothetical protein